MRAGQHKKPIVIQKPVMTQDVYNQPIPSWETYLETWAMVKPMTGREYFLAQQISSEVMFKFTIRYHDGITTKMRILYNNRTFNIKSVLNLNESDRVIDIMALEEVE